MAGPNDYTTKSIPTWCPGCGNFGILAALKQALSELKIEPSNLCTIGGIGCCSKVPYWVKNYGFNSLHGRALPVAQGIKLANTKMEVIAISGDGDGVAEGTNHFVHACRRNIDMLYIIHNNQIYGLTTGQASPTSDKGFVTISSPFGTIEPPINICLLAISSGATFVARGFAGDMPHLKELIVKGIKHKGFAVLEVLQPCVTFNKKNTFDWDREHCVKVDSKYSYKNKLKAMEKAMEHDKIPLGVIYEETRATYEDEIPQLAKKTLVQQQPNAPVVISSILEKEFC